MATVAAARAVRGFYLEMATAAAARAVHARLLSSDGNSCSCACCARLLFLEMKFKMALAIVGHTARSPEAFTVRFNKH